MNQQTNGEIGLLMEIEKKLWMELQTKLGQMQLTKSQAIEMYKDKSSPEDGFCCGTAVV